MCWSTCGQKKAPLGGSIDVIYETRKHSKKYTSLAEDMGTNARFIQYVLIRILNKLGSFTAIFEIESVGAFLGLNVSLSSESYVFVIHILYHMKK